MNGSLDLHRVAQHDLEECAEYIRQNNPRSALRFLRAARTTMERLLATPALGSRYESDEPELAGVRFFPVSRYRNYLVFYRPTATGIEVLRVLHGARDIERLLAGED
jgi:toxin ParE1/3/4